MISNRKPTRVEKNTREKEKKKDREPKVLYSAVSDLSYINPNLPLRCVKPKLTLLYKT